MKKRVLLLFIVLTLLLVIPFSAMADDNKDSVEDSLNEALDEALDNLDFSDVNELLDGMMFEDVAEKTKYLDGEFDSAERFCNFCSMCSGSS